MFILPGHKHMVADRVVANCKASIKSKNLITLGLIAQKLDGIREIIADS